MTLNLLLISIVYSLINNNAVKAQCAWNATQGGVFGYHLFDLTCAKGRKLSALDDNGGHTFEFSLCTNGESCDGNVMVKQFVTGESTCYQIAYWDIDADVSYSPTNGGQYVFQYQGGDGCGSVRIWKPTFQCDSSVEFEMGTVSETSCVYETTISTKYACDGNLECSSSSSSSSNDGSSDGLSGGSIFLIIFFCAVFVYFIGGYFVIAYTSNKQGGPKDFQNNIPNKSFWITCPKLVMAGCAVTKETIVSKYHQYKNGGENALDEPLGEED